MNSYKCKKMNQRILTIVLFTSVSGTTLAAGIPDYSKQIAPIFRKYCVACHNADDRDGGLSLESFADLQKGGEHGATLLPGDAKSSRLMRLVTGAADPTMPPDGEKGPLETEVELLKAWIDGGAKGPAGAEPDRTVLLTPDIKAAKGPRSITALASSSDGTLLAIGRFGQVELVDAKTKKTIRTLQHLPGKVNSLDFSKEGKWLVTASGIVGLYGEATIWNVSDGSRIKHFQGHRDTMYDAELSPDGKLLATCSYDDKAFIWDVETGRPLRSLTGHNGAIYDLEFSPDGTVLATASGDETCKLWQVATGKRLDTLGQPEAEQYVVRFSPNGRFVVAGGADNRIRVWRFVSKKQPKINPLVFSRFAHEGPIVQLGFSPDGRSLISIAEDRTMKQWETSRFAETHAFGELSDVAPALTFAPGRKFVVGGMDGSYKAHSLVKAKALDSGADAVEVVAVNVTTQPMNSDNEKEPNNSPDSANPITMPTVVSGVIHAGEGSHDADLFRFEAKAGQQWVLEINAARSKSPLDSKIEVLEQDGSPITRVLLQAVRDSYFTFRGKDSNTSDDFRVHNWEEMELNEYLYANGEVVKLWLYPRGPDSGFKVYPGSGNRWNYFDTTPLSHPLHEPCYIVVPHPPGSNLAANGLPVFPLRYENDDESKRRLGKDSRLTFTAPHDGKFLVRVTDVRGFQGDNFSYKLTVRPRQPDFKVTLRGASPTVNAGSGKEFSVRVDRIDDFDGAIRVDVEGMPPGFHVTSPIVIEPGQLEAFGTINALPNAPKPTAENAKMSKVTATAIIRGKTVTKPVNNLGEIKLAGKPKLLAKVIKKNDSVQQTYAPDRPLELTIAPGDTITAKVVVERNGFKGRVSLGKEDAGRNLPHGVFVDNIGLNGLLIVEGKDERTFFITAAKWVPETTRLFHLKAQVEGNQTTLPVVLHVKRPDPVTRAGQ